LVSGGLAAALLWAVPVHAAGHQARAQSAAPLSAAPLDVELDGHQVSITPGVDEVHGKFATVRAGAQRFNVPAGDAMLDPDTMPDVKAEATVKDGFLSIHFNNGGNGWRSGTRTVFAFRHGSLVRLGVALPDTEPLEGAEAQARADGLFLDIDDQLESNGLTAHFNAPGVDVALKEQDGRFVYDPDWCWRLNAPHYAEDVEKLTTSQAKTWQDMSAAFLSMAVIDKYCGRTAALRADFLHARANLPYWDYRLLVAAVLKLEVGKRPG
jgi:hypothetical protein